MSITPVYEDRYEQLKEDEQTIQDDIEQEVLIRLLCGKKQHQDLILSHTCDKMFTQRHIRDIYKLACKYIEKTENRTLDVYDFILSLKNNQVRHTSYLAAIKDMYITSADSENWVMRLQLKYEKMLFAACKNANDYRNAVIEINKYKFVDTECNLFEVAANYLAEYDKKSESMVRTGYNGIDELIGGLQGGNYMILAGSTGMGKTAMALNLVINILKQSKEVLLFSLEMTPEELLSRIISNLKDIPAQDLRNRQLNTNDMNKYAAYTGSEEFKKLENLLKIPVTNNLDIGKIEQIVRKSKADIVFIDYLGLIRSDNQRQSTYEQISDISRRLKLLAIETNKPFVVLHQLNRDMKARADKRPQLSDIRDSGKIEQDADFITFVYRPAYFNPEADKTEMQFIIGKSRHTAGAGKTADLCFSGMYQKILEVKKDVSNIKSDFWQE